jgi:hypothetical protein
MATDCTFTNPCLLTTALARVATLTPALTSDLHVRLRGGRYQLLSPITLSPEHSAPAPYKVIIEAFASEIPVLSGGAQVTGWQLYDATKNIYRAPVPAGAFSRQLYVNGVRAQRARGYFHAPFVRQSYGYDLAGFPVVWQQPSDLELVSLSQWKTIRCPVAAFVSQGATTALHIAEPCWTLATGGAFFAPV